jgi:prevent-host-death family protein
MATRTISALELRKKLGEILDRAAAGERIVVERDRRPLAMLVSYEDGQRLEESPEERRRRIDAAFARLDELRERLARDYPEFTKGPDAATLIRQDRDRHDPDFDPHSIPPRPRKPAT